MLVERFPYCFAEKGAPLKMPLKIGIGLDILLAMPELSAYSIAAGLEDYTWGASYCLACKAGAERIGLDGKADGKVSQAEAEHALSRLALFERSNKKSEASAPAPQDTESDAP